MRKTKDALHRIVGILRKHKVPFQISGGFAAKIYGANRPLHDIDIDIPDKYILDLVPEVKKYIIYGPAHYHDEDFDMFLTTLNYKGQEIDLGGCSDEQIFSKKHKRRENLQHHINASTKKKILGLILPIMPIDELVKYKKKLIVGGPYDRQHIQDIKEITQSNYT